MALKTPIEMAELYQTAIEKVLSGQKWTIGDKTFEYPDLGELEKRFLYWRNTALQGGGVKIRSGHKI
jgi:hypothetical protein